MGAECPFSVPHLFYCQGWGAGEAALGQLSGNPSEDLECSLPSHFMECDVQTH